MARNYSPSPIATEMYRERTAASRPINLSPKRCACGKATTAKQLAQYRACVKCVRAAAAIPPEKTA